MSSVDEMNNNGIEITKACYYSGINRITYYYNKKHQNKELSKECLLFNV